MCKISGRTRVHLLRVSEVGENEGEGESENESQNEDEGENENENENMAWYEAQRKG